MSDKPTSTQPSEKPIEEWPTAWLKLEVAGLIKNPGYLIMTRDQKLERDLPVTDEEMREFIKKERK